MIVVNRNGCSGSWYGAAPVKKMARFLDERICLWLGSVEGLYNPRQWTAALEWPSFPSRGHQSPRRLWNDSLSKWNDPVFNAAKYNSLKRANKYYPFTLTMTDASGSLQKNVRCTLTVLIKHSSAPSSIPPVMFQISSFKFIEIHFFFISSHVMLDVAIFSYNHVQAS